MMMAGEIFREAMEILEPIDTSLYTRKTKEDLMEKVRSSICDAFERISKA